MSDRVDALKPKTKHPNESLGMAIDFSRVPLDDGESIAAVASIVVEPAGEVTISDEVVTASTIDDDEETPIAAGQAITFRAAGGVAGRDYRITANVTTTFNGESGNTRTGVAVLQVRDGKP